MNNEFIQNFEKEPERRQEFMKTLKYYLFDFFDEALMKVQIAKSHPEMKKYYYNNQKFEQLLLREI
jgi:menaquinone-dependent protoporphyrinogen IX oxidase